MLDFYLERPYVAKPNLTIARTLSILLIVLCVLNSLSNMLVGYWGYEFWNMYIMHLPMHVVDILFCIFLAIYLNHFGMKMPSIMLYVKIGISIVTAIASPIIHLQTGETGHNIIQSSVNSGSSFLHLVIYIIIAISLIKSNKDYIGGLKAVGCCYLLTALATLLSMTYGIVLSVLMGSGDYLINDNYKIIGMVSGITNILYIVSCIALGISTFNCYQKANQHNQWMISDEAA